MRKLICILISIFAISTICDAQLISSRQLKKYKPHAIWVDLSLYGNLSTYKGDITGNSFGAGAAMNLRWTKRYTEHFAMDYMNFGVALFGAEDQIGDKEERRDFYNNAFPRSIVSFTLGPRFFIPTSDRNSLFLSYNAGGAAFLGVELEKLDDEDYLHFLHELNLGIDFHKRMMLALFVNKSFKKNFDNITFSESYSEDYSYSMTHTLCGLKFGFSF